MYIGVIQARIIVIYTFSYKSAIDVTCFFSKSAYCFYFRADLLMTITNTSIQLLSFFIKESLLTHIVNNTYKLNSELTKNADLDFTSTQIINLLTRYLDENYVNHNIAIRLERTVSTDNRNNVPLNIIILAESGTSEAISEDISNTLCAVATKFIQDVQGRGDDMFSENDPKKIGIFTPEQNDLIDEYSNNFLEKCSGKSITRPFVCVIHGTENIKIKVQGTFKPPVTQPAESKDDVTFFAHSDGAKASDMLIFLKRVGTTNKLVSGTSRDFIADKDSHTKIAAAALASANPLVKVVSYEKTDAKGKTLFYIKDISQANIEDLGEFELEPTD